MAADARRTSRRSLLKYALGTLGSLAAPSADIAYSPTRSTAPYKVVDKWDLSGGGSGLFIAVAPGLTREGLKALGQQLRVAFDGQPNVVVEIFDNAEAARTVRTGSRTVGEEQFAAAMAHQRASYRKSARSGQDLLTIYGESPETVRY